MYYIRRKFKSCTGNHGLCLCNGTPSTKRGKCEKQRIKNLGLGKTLRQEKNSVCHLKRRFQEKMHFDFNHEHIVVEEKKDNADRFQIKCYF